jgi:hypothetical protein
MGYRIKATIFQTIGYRTHKKLSVAHLSLLITQTFLLIAKVLESEIWQNKWNMTSPHYCHAAAALGYVMFIFNTLPIKDSDVLSIELSTIL